MKAEVIRNRLRQFLIRVADGVGPAPKQDAQKWVQLGLEQETEILWNKVNSRTMTSIHRLDALRQAVEYIHANSIQGDIVECGVWRGGSMMAAALTLIRLGATRPLWLYDTFSGMPPPGHNDIDFQGRPAREILEAASQESVFWAKSTLEDVRSGMRDTCYPEALIKYIEGPVEETIPMHAPAKIALLRLDTDWYQSTLHELVHLWDRISSHGILIIDDYGDWAGAKKAVDQFFEEIKVHPFLHRIDGTGRLVIKRG